MEALAVLAVIVPAVAGVIVTAHLRRAAREEAEKAARGLGLDLKVHGLSSKVELRGEVEGRPVFARVGAQTLYVRVRSLAAPARLAFTAVASQPGLERRRSPLARDVEIGDPDIDDYWTLDGGREGVVRALFTRAELQRFLQIWSRLSLSPDGTLEVERVPEPGPDVAGDVRRACELASLLESLADIEPADVPRVVLAQLEARATRSASGAPVPVPSLAPPDR